MQISVDAPQHQQHNCLQSLLAEANAAAALGPDMRVPEIEGRAVGNKTQPQSSTPELSALDREAQKDAAVLSIEELRQKYGQQRADKAIAVVESQVPTARQVFTKHRKHELEGKRELGRGLAAAGIQIPRHSVKDYTHVIVTQLDLLQDGALPSVSAVVNAAFPDDPKKATSIKNSQNGKRRKLAYNSPAVMIHPMEKAMQLTHGREGMNRRGSARTFGQSLGINLSMFKSCDRITKLEARVQLLEQQMQATKQREALADAGVTTPKEMVLSLHAKGIGPRMIAKQLGMELERVRSIIYRSKRA